MSREIKFRAWYHSGREKPRMTYLDAYEMISDEGGFNFPGNTILMQYTGLKDKHGKEIYEGDIIQSETHYYGNKRVRKTVIEWQNDLEHDGFGEPLAMGYIFRGGNLEVIGNIHENPELLK